MTDQAQASPAPNDEPSPQDGGNTISPLPGEAGIPNVARRQTVNLSWKNISIIGLVLFMVGGITFSYLYRLFAESGDSEKDKSMLRDRPSAAGAGTRQLDMTPPAPPPGPVSYTPQTRPTPP
jgi:type IV secretion system protein VirB10